jgi:SAM-dependent methyltransferase
LSDHPLDDLVARLTREREAADRAYNDALTAVDRAIPQAPKLPAAPAAPDPGRLADLNDRWNVLPSGVPRFDRSLRGRLRGFIWQLVGAPLQAQAAFNSTIVEHLNQQAAWQQRSVEALTQLRDALQAELQALARFDSLLVQYLQTITAFIDTKDRALLSGDVRERIGLAEQRILALKREVERGLERASGAADAASAAGGSSAPAAAFTSAADSVTYVGFEDRFRGTPVEIGRRVEDYLPILGAAQDVVDVGCGRGELLLLLRDRGIRARGVDANPAMVETCRGAGLDVTLGDALPFLERQADASLGGLSAIQVVEHFEPAYLARFLQTAYHKLRPGAPLVLETINAACWMAFFETYLRDLTHQRPLHPDTLRFLVEASGFTGVDVRFRQPVPPADRLERVDAAAGAEPPLQAVVAALNAHADKLNSRLFSSMDYAVVARR